MTTNYDSSQALSYFIIMNFAMINFKFMYTYIPKKNRYNNYI